MSGISGVGSREFGVGSLRVPFSPLRGESRVSGASEGRGVIHLTERPRDPLRLAALATSP